MASAYKIIVYNASSRMQRKQKFSGKKPCVATLRAHKSGRKMVRGVGFEPTNLYRIGASVLRL